MALINTIRQIVYLLVELISNATTWSFDITLINKKVSTTLRIKSIDFYYGWHLSMIIKIYTDYSPSSNMKSASWSSPSPPPYHHESLHQLHVDLLNVHHAASYRSLHEKILNTLFQLCKYRQFRVQKYSSTFTPLL